MRGARSAGFGGGRRFAAALLSLLALLVQVNAPIRATAMALGDDMTSGICSVQGSERTDRRAPDDKAPAGKHETCAACVICHLAGPAPAPLPVTIPPVSIALIARPTPPREVAPRAPPQTDARARAPPLNA